jgi:hypothetical protein
MPSITAPRAGQDPELVEAAVDVELGDLADPRLAAAAGIGDPVAADLTQVLVVTRHISADAAAHVARRALRRLLLEQLLDRLLLLHPLEVDVGVDVLVARAVAREEPLLVGAEEPRPLGADRHVLVRDRADVVLRERVGEARGEALDALRRDVWHAELRPLDLRLQRRGVSSSGARGKHEHGQQCRASHRRPASFT